MSSAHLDAAACVKWPSARSTADTTHSRGVIFRVANATSHTAIGSTSAQIPKSCRGRYWRFLTSGANVEWAWLLDGDTAPTLSYGQTSTMGTGAAAAAPRLMDGIPEHIMCPVNAYALVFISSAATGTFEASLSGRATDSVK